MSRKADLVDVVEASYRLDCDDDTWLDAVVSASQPYFDRGKGVYGFRFDASDPRAFRMWGMAMPDDPLVAPDLVVKWHELIGPELVWRMYSASKPYALISDRLGLGAEIDSHPAMQAFCAGLGVVDQLTLRAVDPSYRGVTVCTPVANHVSPESKEAGRWTRIAAHVAAGHRLRERLRAEEGGEPADVDVTKTADAILDPDGRCLHAEREAKDAAAREAFRTGARAMDRARSSLRRESPDEAIEIWRGLIEGTWSMVDHFESDGRRLLVARRNDPDAVDPKGLTPASARSSATWSWATRPRRPPTPSASRRRPPRRTSPPPCRSCEWPRGSSSSNCFNQRRCPTPSVDGGK